MSRTILSGTRALFAVATIASLGFGATQALASSGERASDSARETCTSRCVENCWRNNYDTGGCDNRGVCFCWNYN
ncbi:MAG TPA: hypothetical protein VFQ76_15950 [Longimicrobiaceae bacterium]|nr:hypothetical protein [Longimicrobiaceae bacterium]